MDEQNQSAEDYLNYALSEVGTRINEIEEKQRLTKDRVLLIGENLITTREELEQQNSEFKKQLKEMQEEIKTIKQLIKRILNEITNFAKKPELEILNRQMKMFQPLDVARISDVQQIVREEIGK